MCKNIYKYIGIVSVYRSHIKLCHSVCQMLFYMKLYVCATALSASPKHTSALHYYATHSKTVEVLKDDNLQQLQFRISDEVGTGHS